MKLTLPQIRRLVLFITSLVLAFLAGIWASNNGVAIEKKGNVPQITIDRSLPKKHQNVDFSLFWNVWDRLESEYFDKTKLNSGEMVYGAIKGMVASIGDPYTTFLSPDEQKRTKEDLGGEFEGVGIQIGFRGSQLTVIAPLEGTPAEKAGIKAGDFIVGIKDETKDIELSTYGMTLPDAVEAIRGRKGTPVTLVITRKDVEDPLEIEIVRARIEVPSVELAFVGSRKNIAHLQLLRFGGKTNGEWSKAIKKIQNEKPEGLILDLRNNPGGYLTGSVDVASAFLNKGTVVIQEDGKGGRKELEVTGKPEIPNIPVIVLVNAGSASASEIVAAALKEHGRARVVGEKTFGKGTIQEAQEIDSAGLHITTARWLTPKGNWLDEEGLTPDVEVEDNPETADIDEQLEEAIKLLQ